MQNAALRTATGAHKTQTYTICMTKHSHLQLHTSQYKQRTQSPSHHTTYFNIPRLKTPLFLTTAATQQTFPQSPHSHYNRHKNKPAHIYTYIVSMHLATRSNNKILCTPPPHISSSEEIHPRITRHTLAQLRTNKYPFFKSYLHKVDAKHIHHHYTPSVTSTHTTHIISSTAPTCAPHCQPWICGQTPLEWLSC